MTHPMNPPMTQPAMAEFEKALNTYIDHLIREIESHEARAAVLALHREALARTIEFDGVQYDLEDMRAVARTALENWKTCLKERDWYMKQERGK